MSAQSFRHVVLEQASQSVAYALYFSDSNQLWWETENEDVPRSDESAKIAIATQAKARPPASLIRKLGSHTNGLSDYTIGSAISQ